MSKSFWYVLKDEFDRFYVEEFDYDDCDMIEDLDLDYRRKFENKEDAEKFAYSMNLANPIVRIERLEKNVNELKNQIIKLHKALRANLNNVIEKIEKLDTDQFEDRLRNEMGTNATHKYVIKYKENYNDRYGGFYYKPLMDIEGEKFEFHSIDAMLHYMNAHNIDFIGLEDQYGRLYAFDETDDKMIGRIHISDTYEWCIGRKDKKHDC